MFKRRSSFDWNWRQWTLAAVVVSAGSACGGEGDRGPTSPSGPDDLLSFEVSCPESLLIGQRASCVAVARLRSGQTPLVSPEAAWSSTHPEVVTVDATGSVTGRSSGQAVVSASYRSRTASAPVAVAAQDALRIQAAAEQGDFRPGSTVTMFLQGYYAVASASTGQLSLQISDQNGPITRTPSQAVQQGGDFFLLSSTFVIPQSSTEVCRTAVLEVGPVTVSEPTSNVSGLWCLPVRPQ